MLTVGSAPFNRPVRSEIGFKMIADGKIVHLLSAWNRLDYVTQPLLEVLYRLLRTDEAKRITTKGLVDHPWVKREDIQPPKVPQHMPKVKEACTFNLSR